MINTNSNMFQEMKDKEYRDLYVESQVRNGVAFQVRALRSARKLKQGELAALAGTKQTAISRIENRVAGMPNVSTLLNLAKVFDVALVIRFEPINRYLDYINDLSPEDMAPLESVKILESMEEAAQAKKYTVHDATNVMREIFNSKSSKVSHTLVGISGSQTGTQGVFDFMRPELRIAGTVKIVTESDADSSTHNKRTADLVRVDNATMTENVA